MKTFTLPPWRFVFRCGVVSPFRPRFLTPTLSFSLCTNLSVSLNATLIYIARLFTSPFARTLFLYTFFWVQQNSVPTMQITLPFCSSTLKYEYWMIHVKDIENYACMYSFLVFLTIRILQNLCDIDMWRLRLSWGDTIEMRPPSGGLIFDR